MAELLPENARMDDSFVELVSRYFSDSLDQAELDLLVKRLETDHSARHFFVQVSRLDGLLTERSLSVKRGLPIAPDYLAESTAENPMQLSLHDASVYEAIRAEELAAANDEQFELPEPIFIPPIVVPDRRYRLLITLSAAAILLISVMVGIWVVQSPTPIPFAARIVPTTQPTVPTIGEVQTPKPVPICLAASVRARWDVAGPILFEGDTIPDVPLSLRSGWIRLDFPTGVKAVIEAPARFRVISNSKILLDAGRIAANVPPAGHGFTIQSPTCRAVDLGTDFGMSVEAQGQSQVEVFGGKVSFSSAKVTSVPEILVQGEGRKIESALAAAVAVSANPNSFVRLDQFNRWTSHPENQTARLRAFNEQFSRDPGLMLFYNLGETDDRQLKNLAASTFGQYDQHNVDQHGPAWVRGRTSGVSAMDFDGSKQQYMVVPRIPITQTGKLSASVWVNARSLVPYGSIIKNWGNSKSGSFHLGLAGDARNVEIELDGTRAGGPVLSDPGELPIGRWVHIAFVSDGKNLRLYRDGKEVASGPSRDIQADPPITSMAIGCKTGDDGMTPAANIAVGFWDGQIGEIALFNRVLSAEEIAVISQQGR